MRPLPSPALACLPESSLCKAGPQEEGCGRGKAEKEDALQVSDLSSRNGGAPAHWGGEHGGSHPAGPAWRPGGRSGTGRNRTAQRWCSRPSTCFPSTVLVTWAAFCPISHNAPSPKHEPTHSITKTHLDAGTGFPTKLQRPGAGALLGWALSLSIIRDRT